MELNENGIDEFDFDARLRRLIEYDHAHASAAERHEAAVDLHMLLAVAEGKLPMSTNVMGWIAPAEDGQPENTIRRTLPGQAAAQLWPLVLDLIEVDVMIALVRASSFLASHEFWSAPDANRAAEAEDVAAGVCPGEDEVELREARAERRMSALAVQVEQAGTAAGILAQLYPLADHLRGARCRLPASVAGRA